jgi:Mn-containing catalase
VPPFDLPAQESVFAPDYAPEEIAEIARKLREAAGLPDEPTGVVANNGDGMVQKVKDAVT